MKNIKVSLAVVVLIIMTAFNTVQAEPFMSDIVRAELEQVNSGNKSVVFNGKQYIVSIDASISSYRSDQDKSSLVKLNDLKPGNLYYFEVVAKGKDMKGSNYTDIIFISDKQPSE